MIELVGLNKSFATTQALLDINLFIQEGEIFGIIGKSGAGKSTLLRTMNLLEPPDTGQVIIDNQQINYLKPRDLCQVRHKIGMIFQQFNLLNAKTVYDNIALPMRFQHMDETTIAAKIEELLKLVELTDKRDAYPEQLSGGQKQRVAIARALACSPKILLCDEATSALDPETTSSILALLKRINQLYGITMALITHEMEVVKKICHRLAVIEAGRIIELTSLAAAINKNESPARTMIFSQLTPHLPPSISNHLITAITNKPVIKIYFQDDTATTPFISKISRDLQIDINILLANIDRIDNITCGVLIVELFADAAILAEFLNSCRQANLIVEILGYVTDSVI